MHVIHPATYQPRRVQRRKRHWWAIVLLILLVAGTGNYFRPLPVPTASLTLPQLPAATQPNISWPGYGQAAIGAPGYGTLASSGNQTPLATASITKVITALCVLQQAPLALNQSGPTYIIGSRDVAIYDNYVTQNGSVAAVAAGEKLTEYQALQALLLPSANNIADSLVTWVFGSQSAYQAYATKFLDENGLTHTHIGTDASGFDPSTTSTAGDLTKLGLLALQNPVLMQIAGQHEAELPVAGTVYNYDTILGVNGITGLKTGNNDADPGAFLMTAEVPVGDTTVPVAGAVMGAPDLDTALHSATQLATSLQHGFSQITFAKAGQQLGALHTAWGASAPIVASKNVRIVHWQSEQLHQSHHIRTDKTEGVVGDVEITSGQTAAATNLKLQHSLAGPSFWWRLTRH
jgi:D-alanyl-D-alanine carboxypeptidase (penicillin-binding protein 5/6)